jgi:O-Antigen ligase
LFAVGWLERRAVVSLGLGNLGVASIIMPAALFSVAMSAALQADVHRPRWLALAGLILALLVTTGTRATMVLLVVPLAIVVGARRQVTTRSMRLVVVAPVTVIATLLLGVAFIGVSGADTEVLQERIEILEATGKTSGDASYNERRTQASVASDRFESAPFLGVGPGSTFEWRTHDGILVSSSLIDTPLAFPAKFGLLGLAVLAFALAKYWSFLMRLRRVVEVGIGQLALTGYLAVVVAITPFGMPFDDKGLSFGLILVLALALQEARAKLGAPLPRPDSPA